MATGFRFLADVVKVVASWLGVSLLMSLKGLVELTVGLILVALTPLVAVLLLCCICYYAVRGVSYEEVRARHQRLAERDQEVRERRELERAFNTVLGAIGETHAER